MALTGSTTGRIDFMPSGSEAPAARYMVRAEAIGSCSQASVTAGLDRTIWVHWYPSPMVVCAGETWKFTSKELAGTDTAISGTPVTVR